MAGAEPRSTVDDYGFTDASLGLVAQSGADGSASGLLIGKGVLEGLF